MNLGDPKYFWFAMAMAILVFLVWVSAATGSEPKITTSLRCDSQLVVAGASAFSVRRVCGPPDTVNITTDEFGQVETTFWTYSRSNGTIAVITIKGFVVETIFLYYR